MLFRSTILQQSLVNSGVYTTENAPEKAWSILKKFMKRLNEGSIDVGQHHFAAGNLMKQEGILKNQLRDPVEAAQKNLGQSVGSIGVLTDDAYGGDKTLLNNFDARSSTLIRESIEGMISNLSICATKDDQAELAMGLKALAAVTTIHNTLTAFKQTPQIGRAHV